VKLRKYHSALAMEAVFQAQFSFKFSAKNNGEPQHMGGDTDPLNLASTCQTRNHQNCPNYCMNDLNIKAF
jgi:hypothetical protein